MTEGYNPIKRCKCGNGWEMHGGRCKKCKDIGIKKKKEDSKKTPRKRKKPIATRNRSVNFPK